MSKIILCVSNKIDLTSKKGWKEFGNNIGDNLRNIGKAIINPIGRLAEFADVMSNIPIQNAFFKFDDRGYEWQGATYDQVQKFITTVSTDCVISRLQGGQKAFESLLGVVEAHGGRQIKKFSNIPIVGIDFKGYAYRNITLATRFTLLGPMSKRNSCLKMNMNVWCMNATIAYIIS